EKRTLEKRPTESTEAYTLYLKGRYYWNERNRASIQRGIAYLEKAAQADPNMALAYSDLAVAYVMAADYSVLSPTEAYQKIREYSTKALEMDPSLSEPHAALGIMHERNYEWALAEQEFRKALEINPNNSITRHWYALDLYFQGKIQDAILEWRRAKEVDPLSLIIGTTLGYSLVRTGHVEEGLTMQTTVVEMNDAFEVAHRNLAYSYMILQRIDDAAREARRLLALSREPVNAAVAASVLAIAGFKDEATSILNELLNRSQTGYVDPAQLGAVYAALGDEAKAFELLDKAVSEKSAGVPYASAYPAFDAFRSNPRFRDLLNRITKPPSKNGFIPN
ncbi:MAG TPA: hypothetical protein VFV92_00660, partial [Candidatus Bathyarchaeia archaeon]|nr:hypothetical protein [Candidatus Bathyarchaeia archaeon]